MSAYEPKHHYGRFLHICSNFFFSDGYLISQFTQAGKRFQILGFQSQTFTTMFLLSRTGKTSNLHLEKKLTANLDNYINKILFLPGTPDAFGSLCTYFMCSIRSSPDMQSFWQMGQQLGLGPPTNAVCCWNKLEKNIYENEPLWNILGWLICNFFFPNLTFSTLHRSPKFQQS